MFDTLILMQFFMDHLWDGVDFRSALGDGECCNGEAMEGGSRRSCGRKMRRTGKEEYGVVHGPRKQSERKFVQKSCERDREENLVVGPSGMPMRLL